jgi:hypothetical protein
VLLVAAVRDRSGRYYLADRAPTSRSTGTPRSTGPPGSADASRGRWAGAGAAAIGRSGRIGDEELAHVLSGRHPESGRPLVVRPGTVAGYDLTFAAPKSVSVLLALAGPDAAAAVEAAHDVAVDRALGYVDRRARRCRRTCRRPDRRGDRCRFHPSGQPGARPTPAHPRRRGQRGPRSGRAVDRDRQPRAVRPRGRGRPALRRRAPARVVGGARGVVVGRRGRPLRGGRHRRGRTGPPTGRRLVGGPGSPGR